MLVLVLVLVLVLSPSISTSDIILVVSLSFLLSILFVIADTIYHIKTSIRFAETLWDP